MEKDKFIYLYVNKINGHQYVGQTNNIQIGEIQNVDSSNIKQSSGMSIKTSSKGRGVV